MKLGLQKTTLVDFPGEVAATIFFPGCNLRCPYCHNPDLVLPPFPEDLLDMETVKAFLRKRAPVLGGVCLTGGEPLLHEELFELADFIHSLGLKVKVDTNGTLPQQLCRVKADYIAMDVKTSPGKYDLVGLPGAGERVLESVAQILSSGIPHEFRTTVAPGIVTEADISRIAACIQGADRYVLAQFRPGKTLDPAFENTLPYTIQTLETMKALVEKAGIPCKIRAHHRL